MARQIINTGSAANDGTGDTLRNAGSKINANFSELYGLVGGGSANTTQLTDSGLDIIHAGGKTKVGAATVTGDKSFDFPATGGNIVIDVAAQILTNKTLTQPNIDSAVLDRFSMKDADSSHSYKFIPSNLAADRNVVLPLLSDNDTIVMNDHTATLTNKTLTTPTITRATIHEHLADSAGTPVINFTGNLNGNNSSRLRIQTTSSGDATLSAFGNTTNIGLDITSKGNKTVNLSKYSTNVQSVAAGANIGSGQTDITASIIKITGASGATINLQDAVVTGTILHVIRANVSGTQTITPANFLQGTTIDFTANDAATLVFDGTNWYVVGGQGYAIS